MIFVWLLSGCCCFFAVFSLLLFKSCCCSAHVSVFFLWLQKAVQSSNPDKIWCNLFSLVQHRFQRRCYYSNVYARNNVDTSFCFFFIHAFCYEKNVSDHLLQHVHQRSLSLTFFLFSHSIAVAAGHRSLPAHYILKHILLIVLISSIRSTFRFQFRWSVCYCKLFHLRYSASFDSNVSRQSICRSLYGKDKLFK